MSETRIAIVGAMGRMGQSLIENLGQQPTLQLACALVQPGERETFATARPHIVLARDAHDAAARADVVVDFSSPTGCIEAARAAAQAGKAFVSGTTGLAPQDFEVLRQLAQRIPVLHAFNFSVGVNVLEHLVELAARACPEAWDVEVFEAHHRHKVDAPSGTALFLGEAAARGREARLADKARWQRHGHTGARPTGEIGFQVVRGGDIVGEHSVWLCAQGERLELAHRATDRGIFGRGALRAATWIAGRAPGSYDMKHVLFAPER